MAISEACKFEIHEEVTKMVTDDGISKSEAFRKTTDFFRSIGIEIKESTIKGKYYRAEKVVTNVTPESNIVQPAEINISLLNENTTTEENITTEERPRCKACRRNLVVLTNRTKKPVPSGLCQQCRKKETDKKKNNPLQTVLNEPKIDPDHQEAWVISPVKKPTKRTREGKGQGVKRAVFSESGLTKEQATAL